MTDTATLSMPLRPVPPDLPRWSPAKFRRAIEAERRRAGATKTEIVTHLAGVAKTSVATIYAWRKDVEDGGQGRPDYDQTMALGVALGVDPEAFGE